MMIGAFFAVPPKFTQPFTPTDTVALFTAVTAIGVMNTGAIAGTCKMLYANGLNDTIYLAPGASFACQPIGIFATGSSVLTFSFIYG